MRSLTWDQVRARRLARNHLLEPAPRERLVDVVRDVCGIHVQVMAAGEIGLGIRVAETTREDVRRALWEDRSLVKTSVPRGTLHLQPADELQLWTAPARIRPYWREPRWLKDRGMTLEQSDAVLREVLVALEDGPATREELAEAVAPKLPWARESLESSWNHAVGSALASAKACYGPSRGQKVTFVLAADWLGPQREVDPHDALAEILRRFLRAYAPATPREFAHWFYLPAPDAEALFASLADELEEVDVEGRRGWVLAGDAELDVPPVRDSVRLLPYYDCYVIAAHPRDVLIPEQRQRIFDHGAGPYPALAVDGTVVGTWTRKDRTSRTEIGVEPFARLTPEQRRGLDAAAARVGEILGREAVLSVEG
jgi:hypothetical protein